MPVFRVMLCTAACRALPLHGAAAIAWSGCHCMEQMRVRAVAAPVGREVGMRRLLLVRKNISKDKSRFPAGRPTRKARATAKVTADSLRRVDAGSLLLMREARRGLCGRRVRRGCRAARWRGASSPARWRRRSSGSRCGRCLREPRWCRGFFRPPSPGRR